MKMRLERLQQAFAFVITYLCISSQAKGPIELTIANQNHVLQRDKFCLILLYAPWEEKCQSTFQVMRQLAKHFQPRKDIVVAAGDIFSEKKLGSKFRVEDFCSVLFTIKGSLVPERYQHPITLNHLVRFIESASLIALDAEFFKKPLHHLDDQNFDRIVKDEERDVLVFFHTIWCEKCKDLIKVVKRVAENFKNEPNCVITEIDGQKSFDTATRNDVGVYPTFRFYSRKDKDGVVVQPGKFDENWSEYNLTQLLNLRCQTKRTTHGFLDKTAGRYDELDVLARYFMRNSLKRQKAIEESIEIIHKMPPYKKAKADYYIKVMEKILKDDDSFLEDEIQRIENILHSSISLEKKDDFTRKRNILHHFQMNRRDEL